MAASVALEQGFIYCSLMLSVVTFYVVDRTFASTAFGFLFAAGISLLGLMHAWKFTASDTVIPLPMFDLLRAGATWTGWQTRFPAWPHALCHVLTAVLLLVSARWTKSVAGGHRGRSPVPFGPAQLRSRSATGLQVRHFLG